MLGQRRLGLTLAVSVPIVAVALPFEALNFEKRQHLSGRCPWDGNLYCFFRLLRSCELRCFWVPVYLGTT